MSRLIAPASLAWPIAIAAVELIADRERGPGGGIATIAYRCPANVWTFGLGETINPWAGRAVQRGDTCTEDQAWQMLCNDLTDRAQQVAALLKVPASPNQLGALVSLHYNIGAANFAKSSVLQAHNRGDFTAAAHAFRLWNKARVNGVLQELGGLTARRAAEAALYLQPEPGELPGPMPQAVAPQPALTASPTVVTSAAGAATGAAGIVSQAPPEVLGPLADSVRAVKGFALELFGGALPPWAPWAVLAVVGATVLWRRYGQRVQGLA